MQEWPLARAKQQGKVPSCLQAKSLLLCAMHTKLCFAKPSPQAHAYYL